MKNLPENKEKYICEYCGKVTAKYANHNVTTLTHMFLNLIFVMKNIVFPFQTHLATHVGGDFACDMCEKKFPTPAYLKYHKEQKHLDELRKDPNFKGASGKGQRNQQFDCHLCDNVFKHKLTLNVFKIRHLKREFCTVILFLPHLLVSSEKGARCGGRSEARLKGAVYQRPSGL